jgi:hypothetical protein
MRSAPRGHEGARARDRWNGTTQTARLRGRREEQGPGLTFAPAPPMSFCCRPVAARKHTQPQKPRPTAASCVARRGRRASGGAEMGCDGSRPRALSRARRPVRGRRGAGEHRRGKARAGEREEARLRGWRAQLEARQLERSSGGHVPAPPAAPPTRARASAWLRAREGSRETRRQGAARLGANAEAVGLRDLEQAHGRTHLDSVSHLSEWGSEGVDREEGVKCWIIPTKFDHPPTTNTPTIGQVRRGEAVLALALPTLVSVTCVVGPTRRWRWRCCLAPWSDRALGMQTKDDHAHTPLSS